MHSLQEYLSIYGRLLVNSFALRVDNKGEEESVGTALYRANSIFDHSCRPSATTVFTGGRLQIKATVASDSLDLGQYFISYMDEAESRPQRQAKLKRTWYFECQCPACSDPAGERGKHAAVCDREGCGGQVPVDGGRILSRVQVCVDLGSWAWEDCLACGQSLSKTSRFQYQETYETVRQVVDENGGEIQYTDVAEFLVKQMVGKFHPADLQLMQVLIIYAVEALFYRQRRRPRTATAMTSCGRRLSPTWSSRCRGSGGITRGSVDFAVDSGRAKEEPFLLVDSRPPLKPLLQGCEIVGKSLALSL
jgi:hypothetical protein